MPELALVLLALYLGLAFGLRTVIQLRRTGSTGFVGLRGRIGSVAWLGGVGFALAIVLGVLGPVLAVAGALDPVELLDGRVGHAVGTVMTVFGIASTLLAQFAMGDSWRIGVDEAERTALVTDGPFAIVRNPIFGAMLPTSFGLVLLVPNVVAIAGFVLLLTTLQVQTRAIEEPYLLRTHGEAYAGYAARTGRFLPGIGLLR